jgi:hypothetical protein
MVVAIVNFTDRNLREKMEIHLVEDLKLYNISAVSSYQEFGPKYFEDLTEKETIDKINSAKVDAVLTIVLLDKEKEKYYIPGRVYYTPYTIYSRRFWGYYSTIYERVYEPGYYAEKTNYFWESNLYDMSNKEMIYSIQTKSFNPENTENLAHDYGKVITADLQKNGILK